MKLNRFAKFSLFNVAFVVLVILWGAVVRATGSGAGCADHWPDCRGHLLPSTFDTPMAIEYFHRVTSGLSMLTIFAMGFWSLRIASKGSPLRRSTGIAVFLGLVECAIGAVLVRFKWVAGDTSSERAVVMALHHCNTALLLAALVMVAWFACGGAVPQFRKAGAVLGALGVGICGMLATIVSGAITALGDTLFPAKSTIHTLQQAVSADAHFLERLRVLHPPISIAASLFLVMALPYLSRLIRSAQFQKFSQWTTWAVLTQIALGFINVALRAPIWMQLVHLFVADMIWILLLVTTATALTSERVTAEKAVETTDKVNQPKLGFKDSVRAYVALTKPRVISLLLFTTLAAMFIAAGGVPPFWQLVLVGIGGYMMAGAANAINMVIDSDIDVRMKRTASRPTVTHVISPGAALTFALILATLSFTILTLAGNVLTALLAFAGLLFYVFVYTLLLKRRTWQNIVIGGAAGAFPPLVGYAAVQGELTPIAWFLFALIFFWTPVHFWALALIIKDDYTEAGIPMLPVVRGERATVIQITAYAFLTALISVFPLFTGELGWIYLAFAGILNLLLIIRSWQLMQQPDHPKAFKLFKFSMVYLALVFVVIAVDRSNPGLKGTNDLSPSTESASIQRNIHATTL